MTINELILRGSRAINVRPEVITSPTRIDTIAITRHAIATIAYNQGYKYREIIKALNRKNHTTICNCRRRSAELLTNNINYRAIYNAINSGTDHA